MDKSSGFEYTPVQLVAGVHSSSRKLFDFEDKLYVIITLQSFAHYFTVLL